MKSTYDFLKQEAIGHLNSFSGIVSHLQELAPNNEDARKALESLGVSIKSYSFIGFPATTNNLLEPKSTSSFVGPPESKPGLNYFAPKRILQDLLAMEWFDKVSTDKKRFTLAWRNKLIEDLMASDCRDEVAKAWANKDLRLQIKGHVMGALTKAGVFLKNKYTPIARIYYGTREDSKESDTLAKYMGEYKKTYYGDWIVEYVKLH